MAEFCVTLDTSIFEDDNRGLWFAGRVTNVGTKTIGETRVEWHGQWDQIGNDPQIGKGFHFLRDSGSPKTLVPGQSVEHAIRADVIRRGLSFAASLPPEQFWLSVTATVPGQYGFHEIYRLPGTAMTHIIERLEARLAETSEVNRDEE